MCFFISNTVNPFPKFITSPIFLSNTCFANDFSIDSFVSCPGGSTPMLYQVAFFSEFSNSTNTPFLTISVGFSSSTSCFKSLNLHIRNPLIPFSSQL